MSGTEWNLWRAARRPRALVSAAPFSSAAIQRSAADATTKRKSGFNPGLFPRVARSSQPWALGRNPFGILPGVLDSKDACKEQGKPDALHTLRDQSSQLRNTQKTAVRARTINRPEMKRFQQILTDCKLLQICATVQESTASSCL